MKKKRVMQQKPKKRKLPAPTMTAEEFKRAADFEVGDIVQIMYGKEAGRCAVIMRVGTYKYKGKQFLCYDLKLSDNEGIQASGPRLKLVRHADADI